MTRGGIHPPPGSLPSREGREKNINNLKLKNADIYINVAKEVPGAQMATISGTFLTKVFEGPYQNAGKWAKEMEVYVEKQGKELKKLYFFYTTCPKCAKVYGKNYVVIFAQIK